MMHALIFWFLGSVALASEHFPLPTDPRLKAAMEFWVKIYSQYYTHEAVIHDAKVVELVYEVVDLREKGAQKKIKSARKRYRGSRMQLGQKDRFLEGLQASGRYLPAMEEIFRKEGLPVELTRIPFVESSFNLKARSKVGASGIWQFMRSTGRRFLKINARVDERNDPLLATEAAAKLLKQNYAALGSWPLAITAYNHGASGMVRAVRKVGSVDYNQVVQGYRSRSFGFASSNFYLEFLAALDCERHDEERFGKVVRDPPVPFFEVAMPEEVNLVTLLKLQGFDLAAAKELNPALKGGVFRGTQRMPAKYRLRLPQKDGALSPEAQARVFLAGYEKIPKPYGKARSRR